MADEVWKVGRRWLVDKRRLGREDDGKEIKVSGRSEVTERLGGCYDLGRRQASGIRVTG